MTNPKSVLFPLVALLTLTSAFAADKPKLTVDEFFNSVEITSVKISPDGNSVIIATTRADWEQSIFRKDLWLYRDDPRGGATLVQLTQSGHDKKPQWSPDGRWIAFLSRRTASAGKEAEPAREDCWKKDAEAYQLYLI